MKKYLCVSLMMCFGLVIVKAQKKVHTQHFGEYNNISNTYSGDLSDFSKILNGQTSSSIQTAVNDLRFDYAAVNGNAITNAELETMLVPTQSNYDIWMNVFEEGRDSYVLRSIIMSIRSLM